MKKINKIFTSTLIALTILGIATAFVYADSTTRFDFYDVGNSADRESGSKISGTIGVKATHYTQYYDGKLQYALTKHGLFGDSTLAIQQKDTYNRTVDIAYWYNCSNAKYKETLVLIKKDNNYSKIYGYLSFV